MDCTLNWSYIVSTMEDYCDTKYILVSHTRPLKFPTPSPLFYSRHLSRGQFDSRSSFFAPKPHRNACYAG